LLVKKCLFIEIMVLLAEVSSLKVPALREELKARGLQAYGRKQAMVERLVEHLKASSSSSSGADTTTEKASAVDSSTLASAETDEEGGKKTDRLTKEPVAPKAAEPLKDLLANVTRKLSSNSASDESRHQSPKKYPTVPIGLPPPPASMLSGLPPPPASMLNPKESSPKPSPKPVPLPAPPGMNPERAAMLNRNLQREEEQARRSKTTSSFEGRRERSRDKRRTRSSSPRRKRSSSPRSRKRKRSPKRRRSPSPARRTPHSGDRSRGSATDAFGRSDKTRAPGSRSRRTKKRSSSRDSGEKRRREGKRRRDDRSRREDDRKRRKSRRSRSRQREERRRSPSPVSNRMEEDNDSSSSLSRPRTPSPEKVRVPKSRHRTTESLFMTGFKRPLRTKQLLKDISEYGKVKSFWMNPIKTHCYVTFEDQESSKRCRQAMYGRLYPSDMPKQFAGRLTVEFCSNALAAEKAGGGDVVLATKNIAPPDEPLGLNLLLERVERQTVERGRRKGGQVDILFRKTRSRPHIYWLPLTKEDIARKEEKKKQQHLELERTVTNAQSSSGDRKERRKREEGDKRRSDRRRRESDTRDRRSHRERDEVKDKKGSRKD